MRCINNLNVIMFYDAPWWLIPPYVPRLDRGIQGINPGPRVQDAGRWQNNGCQAPY